MGTTANIEAVCRKRLTPEEGLEKMNKVLSHKKGIKATTTPEGLPKIVARNGYDDFFTAMFALGKAGFRIQKLHRRNRYSRTCAYTGILSWPEQWGIEETLFKIKQL